MKDGKFHLRHRRNLLTYKSHIDKTLLLEFLNNLRPVRYHTICHETADNAHPYEHTHIVFAFYTQPNYTNPRKFDYEDIHPHIKNILDDKHYNNAHNYCFKEDPNVLTNYTDDGTSHSVKVQIEKISKKRKLKEVFFDEDTGGIAKERTYWAKTIFHMSRPRRRTKTKFIVYYGPSGTGKTHCAYTEFPDADDVIVSNNFVMGYHHSSTVIINEFDPAQLDVLLLLRLTDNHPCTIQIKGGETEWNPDTVIITTKRHPRLWYPNSIDRVPDIARRIDILKEFVTPYVKQSSTWGSLNVKDPLSHESTETNLTRPC